MSKRNSFSEKIGKYLGFIAASYSSSNLVLNDENREITENNKDKEILNNNNSNNCEEKKMNNINNIKNINNTNKDIFDTKNFDKIDYIVQIPLIDNPNTRQTRFLLAMDYTLPARQGLGIMDTALEHIVHYYDMNKVELIFCEMWQSVCLFIEFHDIITCTNAYNQLFQFFKTIFYVEDLKQLEELWICAHCKHYNQFDEYLRGLNSINNKRKNKKGDEYVYWCKRCKNVNHPSFKKIKYSYQKIKKYNNDSEDDAKSQKTIGSDHEVFLGHAQGPIRFISHNKTSSTSSTNSLTSSTTTTSNTTTTSSIDNNLDLCYTILETIQQETKQLNAQNFSPNPQLSQIQKTQVINKIEKLNKMLNNIQHTFNQIYQDRQLLSDDDIFNHNHINNHINNDINNDINHNNNNNNNNTPVGTKTNMLMGHARGPIAFKLPPAYTNYNNYNNYNSNK